MTTLEFLSYLHSLDVQLVIDGDRGVPPEQVRLRCTAPEGVLTPELRAQLAERKAELLSFLHQTQRSHVQELASIGPVPRSQFSPLSFAQQRLWFLTQLTPDSPFYNVPTAIRLCGELNLMALEQAFNEIVRRHEALRTTFTKVDDQPVQVIASNLKLSLPVVDLQTLSDKSLDERLAIAQTLATEEAQRPFDLKMGPLLRVKLLKLQETDYILLLTLHHIVADGWSLGVLVRELGSLYTALVQGKMPTLPELPIQYADFAHWQRQWLQGQVLDTQLAYWQRQLRDLPRLNLPVDRARPPVQTYRGATEPISLPLELTTALEALSQQAGVSLFMTLLAAFQTLLHRYTGQDDVVVGSPIANRHRSELEGLIGFFVNSLVLRTDLSSNPTFRELLDRVREVALDAYAHQDMPFEKLVETLEPERNLSRNPLFQVAFALQNAPVETLELPGLTLQPLQFSSNTTRFDLEFHLWERSHGLNRLWQTESHGLSGFVSYSTDLFDRATIVRMLGHFQTLLEGLVANPQARLVDLPILTAAERQQLLVDWNQTQVAYNKSACFHQVFEAQAKQSPDAMAVVSEHNQITYQELDRRANQLAHYLQQLGVGPDTLVGLCVDRSLEMVIGILGILKAGGAYVPLDPTYPRDRLRFLLEDTQLTILLTQSWLIDRLPVSQAQIICLDRESLDEQNQDIPQSSVTSNNLAYVIYTSGSTGKPKGVLIQHQGLCNVVVAQQQAFHISSGSRILQFSSLSFDASIFELVMALGTGSTLYIPPQTARLPGEALAQFLRHHAITHAILPPAVLAVLPSTDFPALTTLIAGGEACSSELVDRWAVDRQFFNAYGPTETTIWATVGQLHPASGKPTIGRPVANTQIYILDAQLQPVPIGVTGELHISGDGLAQGYLNRPELTSERFIPTPHFPLPTPHSPLPSPQPLTPSSSPRLYKTGDLARYHHDGTIEFIGREDDQVKIRGFRIELSEIEAVLNQHPAVQKVAAIAHDMSGDKSTGDKRLAAYLTLNLQNEQVLSAQQLQQQQVEHWQTLYNQTYQQASIAGALMGWNSSYTGQPIPPEQMQEWVDDRVQQILALKPKRILEIGCGTGLLLFQLAPHCVEYVGTDFSIGSLNYIQHQLSERELPQVKLLHRTATNFDGLDAAFDVVILNSVVQYFPNLDYLMQVLEGALQVVAPDGYVFIGDVRSLPLLKAFHTAVQLHQSDNSVECKQLRQQVQRSLFEDPELAIDPTFFCALQNATGELDSKLDRVHIRLSRGHADNEMTQFRYNVLLHVESGISAKQESSLQWQDWTTPTTVVAVRQHLMDTQPDLFGLKGIPNAQVIVPVKATEFLFSGEPPKTVGRLCEKLENLSETAISPQVWYDLEAELPYRVEICWSASADDRYDVLFKRQDVECDVVMPFTQSISSRPWKTYTNQPLQAQFARQLIPQLRQYLEHQLPEYMIPTAFVVLETLPLTASGKVDRRALLLPDEIQPQTAHTYAAARSPIESTLTGIWIDLLRIKQVGIHDNFFELGGHSLLATQMASRIRDVLKVDVPLRSVFEAPTIAQLASVVEALQMNQAQKQAPALVPLDRESRRRLRSSLSSDQRR